MLAMGQPIFLGKNQCSDLFITVENLGQRLNPKAARNDRGNACSRGLFGSVDLRRNPPRAENAQAFTGDGFPDLFDVFDELEHRLAVIRGQRETIRKLLEATIEGIYVFKTRPDVTLAALRDEGVDDPQIARSIYDRLAGSLRAYPFPDLKGIQAALDSVAIAKDRNPQAQDFIDASILEEIKKSGYIDRLYKK